MDFAQGFYWKEINICMNLIINSSLCEPPSEINCFRDVTLYGKIFIFEDILLHCAYGTRSLYWSWLKKHGAHDFISELIRDHETERGFWISPRGGNLNINKIDVHNLNFIISAIKGLRKTWFLSLATLLYNEVLKGLYCISTSSKAPTVGRFFVSLLTTTF